MKEMIVQIQTMIRCSPGRQHSPVQTMIRCPPSCQHSPVQTMIRCPPSGQHSPVIIVLTNFLEDLGHSFGRQLAEASVPDAYSSGFPCVLPLHSVDVLGER